MTATASSSLLILTAAWFGSLLGLVAAPRAEPDWIYFANGDRLRGSFAGVNENQILWESEGVATPIRFNLGRVAELRLRPDDGTRNAIEQEQHLIHLHNGDQLPGRCLSIDDQHLIVQTYYAGKLKIPRNQARQISFKNSRPPVHRGPQPGQPWVKSNRGRKWIISEDRLIADQYSSIGANLSLPWDFRFRFDLEMRKNPTLDLFLCLKSPEDCNQGDFYQIQISPAGLTVFRQVADENASITPLGSFEHLEHWLSRERITVECLIHRSSGTLIFLIDGVRAGLLHDPSPAPPEGEGIVFSSFLQGELTITRTLVEEWDDTTFPPQLTSSDRDIARMAQGDRLSGRLESLSTRFATLETHFKTLSIPLLQLSSIDLAPEPTSVAENDPKLILVGHLNPIGRLQFTPISGDSDVIEAKTAFSQSIQLQIGAMKGWTPAPNPTTTK
ncbi:MAG: hypothetical protein AAF514_23600 [Verrucomicrobiota bacterium]